MNELQTPGEDSLTKKELEKWILKYKPYLNPELKITDLIFEFQTNRTYLSAFINRKYGINFSRFINYWRLIEYEKMNADPANTLLTDKERALITGFSNYRGYLRANKMIKKVVMVENQKEMIKN